jgi:hypothetical protein
MKTSIRAQRILGHLANYKKFDPQATRSLLSISYLGEPLGLYENIFILDNDIGIFSDGLVWFKNEDIIPIRFSEIVSTSLPNEKDSKAICLVLNTGKSMSIPFTGGADNFSDSLEILRFLDRVMNDIKNLKMQTDSNS